MRCTRFRMMPCQDSAYEIECLEMLLPSVGNSRPASHTLQQNLQASTLRTAQQEYNSPFKRDRISASCSCGNTPTPPNLSPLQIRVWGAAELPCVRCGNTCSRAVKRAGCTVMQASKVCDDVGGNQAALDAATSEVQRRELGRSGTGAAFRELTPQEVSL